ncbi:hypothetical protein AXG93_1543s1580 [Marchantia polymorpha subsp. ruderalis]|uniref:Uncharacterized protein n=1 Tax=Marchantia polymorpha subsp. ruderalis TaxID=1480154 RepID=A0A176VYU1_MARPO|nr:hypothetical protein AXG93_1543s1580 [Marchantia polymorpha subsp. ruderalis]
MPKAHMSPPSGLRPWPIPQVGSAPKASDPKSFEPKAPPYTSPAPKALDPKSSHRKDPEENPFLLRDLHTLTATRVPSPDTPNSIPIGVNGASLQSARSGMRAYQSAALSAEPSAAEWTGPSSCKGLLAQFDADANNSSSLTTARRKLG